MTAGGCELFPSSSPAVLDYLVMRGPAEISVTLSVAGGPRPIAWVAFGASPLGPGQQARRIVQVAARTIDGAPLAVRQVGIDAWRVEVATDGDWILDYRAEINSPPADFYHRASSSSANHLMLVGVDIWARLFDDSGAVDLAPADRPLGDVARATVRFDTATLPRGWFVASASQEVTLGGFEFEDHPARSVFAVGPYRFQDVDEGLGLRAAVHSDWGLSRGQVVQYARQLARVQTRDFGPPPGDPALLIFTPFPAEVTPAQGVRTAGMVWDRSLLLYAGVDPSARLDRGRVNEMLAIFLGHELFHLYVPWGLPVTQPLSWLSEGWAEHVGRSSAQTAGLLSTAGADRSLREAYERYIEMGGSRAGSLRDASESGEELRPLLYVRGELVFRILSLEWDDDGRPGSFDSALWRLLLSQYDGENPLEPEVVSEALMTMVSGSSVRRLVDGAAVITLPELRLGRR